MRNNKSKIILVIFAIICIFVQDITAENQIRIVENGVALTLTFSGYALSPQDSLKVSYAIQNLDHPGVLFTISGQLGKIDIHTPEGLARYGPRAFIPAVTPYHIPLKAQVTIDEAIDLSSILIWRTDRNEIVSLSDGDTLNIQGLFSPKNFLVSQDSVITHADQLTIVFSEDPSLDWKDFPANGEMSTTIYVRDISADMDRDGHVDFTDFLIFANAFGVSVNNQKYNARADLDGNGKIAFQDFIIFSQKLAPFLNPLTKK